MVGATGRGRVAGDRPIGMRDERGFVGKHPIEMRDERGVAGKHPIGMPELHTVNTMYVRKLGWVPKLQRCNLVKLISTVSYRLGFRCTEKFVLTEQWPVVVTLC